MRETSDHLCDEPGEGTIFVAALIKILAASLAEPLRLARVFGSTPPRGESQYMSILRVLPGG